MAFSGEDLEHLARCVDLARQALAHGDDPFGSAPVAPLPITAVAPRTQVDGPAPEFTDSMESLYEAEFRP